MKTMHSTYFPMEQEYKVLTSDHKIVAEGFGSKDEADAYIAKATNQNLYDIYVIWNREFDWAHYGTYRGDEGLKEYEREVLYQGDGARVKKVKSILRE